MESKSALEKLTAASALELSGDAEVVLELSLLADEEGLAADADVLEAVEAARSEAS